MKDKITYKKAGVNVDKANAFVERIKPLINNVRTPGVMGKIGGFSGIFDIGNIGGDPLLVASTDGVGTKLLIAKMQNNFDTIGIDLVAMCVNDVVTCGAAPLFFLDYFSTGKLFYSKAEKIIEGIIKGCKQSECILLGGETAEMPDIYTDGDFDLAGFCVGVVDKNDIVDGKKIEAEDIILGIQSNGIHSNGFSLVRKVFSEEELQGETGEELLKPTFIYIKPILKLIEKLNVKAIAHITGGGLPGNITRILPKNMKGIINKKNWVIPDVFKRIKKRAGISDKEMFNTFNMGIGMAIVIHEDDLAKVKGILKNYYGLESYKIGVIEKGEKQVIIR